MDSNFLNTEPKAEALLDRDGTAITNNGQPVLHIPKSVLDQDLDFYFGPHNYGIDHVEHYQHGDLLKCVVRCWYAIRTNNQEQIRHTTGSAGDHLTRIYNRFPDKGEAAAIMVPTLQTLAEKNAWAKLGKRFGRDLNRTLEKVEAPSPPAETRSKHEIMVIKMIDHICNLKPRIRGDAQIALQRLSQQGLINTPYLSEYFLTKYNEK
jgi:hypothetical protein